MAVTGISINKIIQAINSGSAAAIAKVLPEGARAEFQRLQTTNAQAYNKITRTGKSGIQGASRFGSSKSFKVDTPVIVADALRAIEKVDRNLAGQILAGIVKKSNGFKKIEPTLSRA